jgi:hypothetical protein
MLQRKMRILLSLTHATLPNATNGGNGTKSHKTIQPDNECRVHALTACPDLLCQSNCDWYWLLAGSVTNTVCPAGTTTCSHALGAAKQDASGVPIDSNPAPC